MYEWHSVCDRYTDDEIQAFRGLGILTLTPDFALQHLGARLLDALRSEMIEIIAAIPRSLSVADVKALYRGRATHARTASDRHLDFLSHQLFRLGPCVILFLRTVRPASLFAEEELQAVIARIKGRSDYGLRRKENASLRGISSIADRALSAVHCPDNLEGLIFEADYHLTGNGTRMLTTHEAAPISSVLLVPLLEEPRLMSGEHPLDVLVGVLRQAIAQSLGSALLYDQGGSIRQTALDVGTLLPKPFGGISIDAAWQQLTSLADRLRAWTTACTMATEPKNVLRWRSDYAPRLAALLTTACERTYFTVRSACEIAETARLSDLRLSQFDAHRLQVLAGFHGAGL